MDDNQIPMSGLTRIGVVGVLTALAMLGTILIRIPIPATTGYFNLGDVFVILAGLWLGPTAGLVVGAIGPSLADAIGFPQFILATMVVKGLEGTLVGLLAGRRSRNHTRKIIAAGAGGATVVVGYFIFEAIVYPRLAHFVPMFAVTDMGAAVIETVPNTVQAIIGAVGGFALWRAISISPVSDVSAESKKTAVVGGNR